MANLTLKVSKSAYEAKITELEDLKNRLDSKVQDYKTAESSMDKFIGQGDDNYESLRENVETNIKTCQKASEMCEASIKALKETLQEMTEAGSNIGSLLSEAGELAKNTLKGAVEVAKLVD